MYTSVAETYLLTNREPDNSIILLGVQIFTVPSLSSFLVTQHQFLSGIISILYSFFTEQLDPLNQKHLAFPPNPAVRRIDPDSGAFRQKRYFQIFCDLQRLLTTLPVQRVICETLSILDDFVAFIDLFTSMNPNRLQTEVIMRCLDILSGCANTGCGS